MPPFLPDLPAVRSDLLDYCLEIEWFDEHLGRMLRRLEEFGELDRTFVVVMADNGMPFPRAKANVYEYGIHVPLAIRWGARVAVGRRVDDLVGFADLGRTLLDAAGVAFPDGAPPPAGRSFLDLLVTSRGEAVSARRDAVFAGRKRHSSARHGNLGYSQRALRTPDHLYIRNFRPARWPAGDPVALDGNGRPAGPHSGYIDERPTLSILVASSGEEHIRRFLDLAVARRPAEELYDVRRAPGCLENLAGQPECAEALRRLAARLESVLRETRDPRLSDGGDIWETYPRYGPMRSFPPPVDGE